MKKLDNILHGVLVALLTAGLIGGFLFYTEYKVYQQKDVDDKEALSTKIDGYNKTVVALNSNLEGENKKYTIKFDTLDIKLDKLESNLGNVEIRLNQLTYAIIKSNKDIKETLDDLKTYGYISNKGN